GTAGHFRKAAEDGASLDPLVTSSERAALVPAVRFQFLSDPGELLNDFRPSGEQYVLAARLSGRLETAFPDGPPAEDALDTNSDPDADLDADLDADSAAAEDRTAANAAEDARADAGEASAKAPHRTST